MSEIVPILTTGTLAPLTSSQWQSLGVKSLAVPALTWQAEQTWLKAAGGVAQVFDWAGEVIVYPGLNRPMKKVTTKAIQSGATYYRHGQAHKLTTVAYQALVDALQPTIKLPLAQEAAYYGPVDDLATAVTINAGWQYQGAWGSWQGGGLKSLRLASLQALKEQGVTNYWLDNLAQDEAEWQRGLALLMALVPATSQTLVIADSLVKIKLAQAHNIDYILTALPTTWASHQRVFVKNQVQAVTPQNVPPAIWALLQQVPLLGQQALLAYNWQQLLANHKSWLEI